MNKSELGYDVLLNNTTKEKIKNNSNLLISHNLIRNKRKKNHFNTQESEDEKTVI